MASIEREKIVAGQMVEIYCRHTHGRSRVDGLCDDCKALLEYVYHRLDKCPKGDTKPTCRKCEIHCYNPQRREQIRDVMRVAGPRMMLRHPLSAIRHLMAELF